MLLVTAQVAARETAKADHFVYGEERIGDNTLETAQQFSDICKEILSSGYIQEHERNFDSEST
jgi:hypothetical protein